MKVIEGLLCVSLVFQLAMVRINTYIVLIVLSVTFLVYVILAGLSGAYLQAYTTTATTTKADCSFKP